MKKDDIRAEVVRLYTQENLTPTQIGIRIGRSKTTVQYYLKTADVAAKRQRIAWPIEQMREWYEQDGMTFQQIADRLGQDARQVGKCARRNGFRTRRVGPAGGAAHPEWKGGRRLDRGGYVLVYCPDHPAAHRKHKVVREHRLVMEQHIGRLLEPHEVVHHINGDKQDNRIENLQLFASNAEHLAETLRGKCPQWTERGIRAIAEGRAKYHGLDANAVEQALLRRVRQSQQMTRRSTA